VLWSNGQVIDLGNLGGEESPTVAINTSVNLPAAPIFPAIRLSMRSCGKKGVMQDLGTLPGDNL